MKKLVLVGVSLFLATSVSASMFLNKSLPLRCTEIAVKLNDISNKQDSPMCSDNIQGGLFLVSASLIEANQLGDAKYFIDYSLGQLKLAKELECNGQPVINWAISEAAQIRKAL